MAKTLTGLVMFAEFELADTFNWTDPKTNAVKPLRSIKVLVNNGDKTITRESISVPDGHVIPDLEVSQVYGFPVISGYSKKRNENTYALRTDVAPFPAPEM
jgi:hypothetical protein